VTESSGASGAKSSFPPEAGPGTRVLILGSLPGEVSLARGQYYAHPQNQFWRLIGAVIGVDLAGAAYPDRLATLRRAGVGLWDVVKTASRVGSLDQHIRDHAPNPLAAFAASLPELRAVGFNGGKAWKIGAVELAGTAELDLVALPSSSPAHTLAFERKLAAWLPLRAYLGPAEA
jgi:TDG/mug DNA glycosylase family protein